MGAAIFCFDRKKTLKKEFVFFSSALLFSIFFHVLEMSAKVLVANKRLALHLKTINVYDLYDTLLSFLGAQWLKDKGFVGSMCIDFSTKEWVDQPGMYYEPKYGPTWWFYFFEPLDPLCKKECLVPESTFVTLDGCLSLKKQEDYTDKDVFAFYYLEEEDKPSKKEKEEETKEDKLVQKIFEHLVSDENPPNQDIEPFAMTLHPVCFSKIAQLHAKSLELSDVIRTQPWIQQQMSFHFSPFAEKNTVALLVPKEAFEEDALPVYLRHLISSVRAQGDEQEAKELNVWVVPEEPFQGSTQESHFAHLVHMLIQEEWSPLNVQVYVVSMFSHVHTETPTNMHWIHLPACVGYQPESPYFKGLYEVIVFQGYKYCKQLVLSEKWKNKPLSMVQSIIHKHLKLTYFREL